MNEKERQRERETERDRETSDVARSRRLCDLGLGTWDLRLGTCVSVNVKVNDLLGMGNFERSEAQMGVILLGQPVTLATCQRGPPTWALAHDTDGTTLNTSTQHRQALDVRVPRAPGPRTLDSWTMGLGSAGFPVPGQFLSAPKK